MPYIFFLLTQLLLVSFAQANEKNTFIGLGISLSPIKHFDSRLKNLPNEEDRYYLEVPLGNLSEEQFSGLQKIYGERSKVPYDSSRNYELIDFLDPEIQALVNNLYLPVFYDPSALAYFQMEGLEGPVWDALKKRGLASYANCWNATSEVLRRRHPQHNPSDDRYFLYWPGRTDAYEWFTSDQYSQTIEEPEIGDVMVLIGKGQIQHTAIFVTNDLIFEKTDGGEKDPYRISFVADVLKKYQRAYGEQLVISYRRFSGFQALPEPQLPYTALLPLHRNLLKGVYPGLNPDQVVPSCEFFKPETCEPTHSVVETAKITIDAETGRGRVEADPLVTQRFSVLR